MLYVVNKWIGDQYETMYDKMVAAYDVLSKAIDHVSKVYEQVKANNQDAGPAELHVDGCYTRALWSDGQFDHIYTIHEVELRKEVSIEEEL